MYRKCPSGFTYVGRPSEWGNPYPIGSRAPDGTILKDAGSTLPWYEKYLRGRVKNDLDFGNRLCLLNLDKAFCPGCPQGSNTCHITILRNVQKEIYDKRKE